MKRIYLAIFTALVWTSASYAIDQASAQQADASAPSGQLDRFVGDGSCTGNIMATDKTSGHATTGKFHGEKTLDGRWVVLHYDEDRTATNPKPFSVAQYIGYDGTKKRFVAVAFDNSSGSYSTGTSSGWKGDTFTLDNTATADGGTVVFRDIFTKSGSNMPSHTGMMRDKNGKWVKMEEETCHKA